jgi:hypothetical protein
VNRKSLRGGTCVEHRDTSQQEVIRNTSIVITRPLCVHTPRAVQWRRVVRILAIG